MSEKSPKTKSVERDFIHLHLHTDYSLLQSTVQLNPLAKRLTELEMRACAITDLGNMYGAVSFFNTMTKAGIKPIIGYEAHITFGSRLDHSAMVAAGERAYFNIVLLAANAQGLKNLIILASKAFTEGFYHRPRIDMALLEELSGGLIGLSGGIIGPVGHYLSDGAFAKARSIAGRFSEIFGPEHFYLELQESGIASGLNKGIIELAAEMSLPLVATNDVYYLDVEDARARRSLIAIAEGQTLPPASEPSEDIWRYLRSAGEMWKIFGKEVPESLTNTLKIADMCDVAIEQGADVRQLPKFQIPIGSDAKNEDEYFKKVLRDGFLERQREDWAPLIEEGLLNHTIEDYEERLRVEIEIILRMGFAGYFLIVWDFIRYSREQNIPVGPGRGSAAGSLAAYCMRITDVDPLQYGLLFERFLNPERVSMPDIDIDFCIRGRSKVIEYVTELYGRDSVCQIVTFGTMASKAAIKDVGRVLKLPYGEVERIAKLMPPPRRGRNISIKQAIKEVPEIGAAMAENPAIQELVDLAQKVEGCSRHTSVHAAGVLISPRPLHELVPIAMSVKDELTSQYPMGDLEKVGMLKMDFLGLTTLTIIQDCLDSMKELAGIELDWKTISTSDPETMQLFAEGRTDAVFQFESSGMQDICRKMRPENIEDLTALNALYRPGPLDGGMIPDFVARRRGLKKVEYIVDEVKEFLEPTFGVFVYQEQIMKIAQHLGGYSLGEADLMRRAMGKKNLKEMDAHRDRFVAGAVAKKIDKKTAGEIFDLMANFADYGFNRSHSVAYAMLAFRTAYLKAHYPAYFFSSVLSHEADDTAKVYKYSNELRSMGLELLSPDINESGLGFTPLPKAVRFGLSAIKGIGFSGCDAIIRARGTVPFTSLLDLVERVDPAALNRRSLESLIAAGAFDSLMPKGETALSWRSRLTASVDDAVRHGQRMADARLRGQSGLFEAASEEISVELADAPPWTTMELAKNEKAAIGFHFTAHPLDEYRGKLDAMGIRDIAEMSNITPSGSSVRMAGLVTDLQVRYSKKGNRFCTFRIEDRTGGVKCIVWAEAFSRFQTILKEDQMIVVEGKNEQPDGADMNIIVAEAVTLNDLVASTARSIVIAVPQGLTKESDFDDILQVLDDHPGNCEVFFDVKIEAIEVRLKVEAPRVSVSGDLIRRIEADGCSVSWN